MPENKFDLNKVLQAVKLYTPIDYRIQVPQLSTMRNFENWRTDQGYKTGEEKQKEFEDNIKAMQERTVGLSDADSATDWYHAMETNPVKRAEWDRQAAAVTGHGIGAIATIASAGTMGWIPSLISTGTGYAGGYGGYKLGEAIDNKYGTNTAPWLSFAGGMLGGYGGYKGLVKLGNAYTPLSLGKTMVTGQHTGWYGPQFGKDVIDDIATQALKKNTIPYGTVKWYGPTMGKTTAAKTNTNLVDFDDYIRPDLEKLASELGMTRQQLMMSQDPTVRERARQVMLKSIDDWRVKPQNDGKTLVISKSDVLQDPIFDNQPLVLKKNTFLQRNAARGETDINNSIDWYNSTRRKGGSKLMEWPDETGVYITELEPFTPNSHNITFTPKQSTKGSYAWFERPSKLTEAERLGIPKGQRNQPIFTEPTSAYGNIRFIRNLNVVPDVEDGFALLAPKENNLLNVTTDIPFRTHGHYKNRPHHYIYFRPEALSGHAPMSIKPMDTFFINNNIKVRPDQITFVSGDINALRVARQRGFRVKSSPELIKAHNTEILEQNSIKNAKSIFGKLSKGAGDLRTEAIDNYFTKLGRPTFDDYIKLQNKTGLSADVVPIQNVTSTAPFYKHIYFEKIPDIESALMKKVGYPQHPREINMNEFINNTKYFLGSSLKEGGKINPQQ